jgi:hypothetical protein
MSWKRSRQSLREASIALRRAAAVAPAREAKITGAKFAPSARSAVRTST